MIFVYVNGLKGPEPQLWQERPANGSGVSPTPLHEVVLPEGMAGLTLDQLAKLYPLPPEKVNV